MAKKMRVGEIRVYGKNAYIMRKTRKGDWACSKCEFCRNECRRSARCERVLGQCGEWMYFDKPTVEEMILEIQKMTQNTYIELTKICPIIVGKTINLLKCWDAGECVGYEVRDPRLSKAFELMLVKIYENKEKCK